MLALRILIEFIMNLMIRVRESGSQSGVAKERRVTLPSHEDTGVKAEASAMTRD